MHASAVSICALLLTPILRRPGQYGFGFNTAAWFAGPVFTVESKTKESLAVNTLSCDLVRQVSIDVSLFLKIAAATSLQTTCSRSNRSLVATRDIGDAGQADQKPEVGRGSCLSPGHRKGSGRAF